ncbi:DNA primase [bacterium]|nr:DNA primase [bacterium]
MSTINNSDIVQQIKDKLDILDVISRTVILKKKGQNYWGLCPFHKEKTPSFSVNPSKGIYKCFSCGEGGDVLSFLMKTQNKSFMDVIRDEAQALGIELPANFGGASAEKKEIKQQILNALKDAAEFYNLNLVSSSSAEKALDYVKNNRELGDDIISTYKLGYAPNSYDDLYKRFQGKYSNKVLEDSGLIIKREREAGYIDRFRHRLIIPIFDEGGNVVGFGARALEQGQEPKYLNSPESIVYNKSKTLYGLYHAKETIKEEDSVIVMEGYFDVISAQAHGIKNCVASCGTSLTQGHINLISRYSKSRKIFLAFDTDSAGVKATQRGAEVIREAFMGLGEIKQFDEIQSALNDEKYACEIRVISPPEGKDPDEFIRTNGGAAYKKYLENAKLLLDFEIDLALKNYSRSMPVTEKLKVVKGVIPILSNINNTIARNEYVKIVADRLNMSESDLLKELRTAKSSAITPYVKQEVIVKKRISLIEKAERNLLSMYLISSGQLLPSQISNMLKNEEFDDETLNYIKSTIDKLAGEVNNVGELIESLYNAFAEDNDIKNIITDLIELAKPYEGLSDADLRLAIDENLQNKKRFKLRQEQEKIRQSYKYIDDDDVQAVQIQIELKEKLKNRLRTGDN